MAGFPADFRMARAAYLTRKRRFINCDFSDLSQAFVEALPPLRLGPDIAECQQDSKFITQLA
jgi:hypothetical protein